MSSSKQIFRKSALALAILAAMPMTAFADNTSAEIDALWQQIDQLNQKVAAAEEWKNPNTLVHMAGFTSVNYESTTTKPNGSFKTGGFSPIFHYQYRDLIMMESELDFQVTESGETEATMEYLTVDLFLNDYAALVVGKFLSPLGSFRQNIHPSWINKLPSAPTGFGHDQAAPNADTGIQLRGGYHFGEVNANYAVYVGNGVAVEVDAGDGEIEMIESPGMGADGDGTKNFGGRFGLFFPASKLELGVSFGSGDVSDREISPATVDTTTGSTAEEVTPAGSISYTNQRSWSMLGADLTYRLNSLDIKAEYTSQTIGANASSAAPNETKFSAYYVQAAYQFAPSKWEVVARYASYTSPKGTNNQLTYGANYVFAANVVAKVAYEDNSLTGMDDRFLAQLAYGF